MLDKFRSGDYQIKIMNCRSTGVISLVTRHWQRILKAKLLLASCMIAPQAISSPYGHDDLFIPNDFHFYNPLKHSDGSRAIQVRFDTVGMDNTSLINAASFFRNNKMSQTQRQLNYLWLHQHRYDHDDVYHGSRALSKMIRMGFKTYWDRWRGVSSLKYEDDGSASGSLMRDVEYDLKVNKSKFRFAVEYKF